MTALQSQYYKIYLEWKDGGSIGSLSRKHNIPDSTLSDNFKRIESNLKSDNIEQDPIYTTTANLFPSISLPTLNKLNNFIHGIIETKSCNINEISEYIDRQEQRLT